MLKLIFSTLLLAVLAPAQSIAGLWTGTAASGGSSVPFRLLIRGNGATVQGAWLNGPERSPSSSGSFDGGHLVLHFADYANTLDATLQNGVLTGTYGGHLRPIPITARRGSPPPASAPDPAPSIEGDWEIAVTGRKGETAWQLHVRQLGSNAVAVIQRIDGDTGSLYGSYANGEFALSHFNADGPALVRLDPQPDGTLLVLEGRARRYTARRPAAAVAVAAADDPLRHTWLQDPTQPLAFRFPDLEGRPVANTDPRFRGKAVIVAIGGSWCPNCHDEAPMLEALYRKYHARGLEVVGLFFEEPDQLHNPTQLRAFIREYGITFPVLLAGQPEQLAAALPQAVNLNCWPTTFFIGRDGLVQRIHTGFSGPATGAEHAALLAETDQEVRKLLEQ